MAMLQPFLLFTPSSLPSRSVGVGWGAMVVPHPPIPSAPAPASRQRRQPTERTGDLPGAPLWVTLLLLLVALLVAPEQPRAQEAICHRHSGVDACRVW
ncbi:MAG: hypothetical protein ACK587_00660 [Cyanobacteriota bacterium]